MILRFLIIPSRSDRHIYFCWYPMAALLMSKLKLLVVGPPRPHQVPVERGPVGLTCKSALIAHPSDVGTCVAEYDSVGLKFPNMVPDFGPVVVSHPVHFPVFVCPTIISCTPIGSIKPYFEDIPVLGQDFIELMVQVFQILFGSVIGVIAIPGRIVDPHFESIGIASLP